MRRPFLLAGAVTASLGLSACVQTRQVADLQFTPPQGDYKLLVLRPDVNVGSVTTGMLMTLNRHDREALGLVIPDRHRSTPTVLRDLVRHLSHGVVAQKSDQRDLVWASSP